MGKTSDDIKHVKIRTQNAAVCRVDGMRSSEDWQLTIPLADAHH